MYTIFLRLIQKIQKKLLKQLTLLIPAAHHFLLDNLCLVEWNDFWFSSVCLLSPFLFAFAPLTCSRCSLFPTGCLCCKALSLSIRIQRIISVRKSTNRLKKSGIESMMWRVLQKRASRRATSKPDYAIQKPN